MARLIQIGNLPESVDTRVLQRLFEGYGAVRNSVINTHFDTGRSTGVGFIEMASAEGGRAAIAALHHQKLLGRMLSVCWCRTANAHPEAHQKMFDPMNMMRREFTGKEINPATGVSKWRRS